ncbi:MAG: glycerophosphodiester phosphodiesterase [Anaerolineales bacterium]
MSYPPMPGLDRRPLVIAHRGASADAPENTLAAFRLALEHGADGIEFDVHQTADGALVVIHDDDLARTTDIRGAVRKVNLADLKTADAGAWFGPAFVGEPVPTLEDVCAWLASNDLLAFVELKAPDIEDAVAKTLRAAGLAGRVQVRSFDHAALQRFYAVAPEIPISELWYTRIPGAGEHTFPTINGLFALYDAETIAALHARGVAATAWTVNDFEAAERLLAWGIDAITTDHPAETIARR